MRAKAMIRNRPLLHACSAASKSNRIPEIHKLIRMSNGDLNWITNFIWGIADDVLRDLYVRGKYRDVILPMTVLRRLDAVLEPTKQAVLDMKARLDTAGITNQDQALRQAAGQSFYNTSGFTLRDLRARASQQQLKADFEAYLDGYSPNVQEIFDNFEFRNQIPRLSKADALGTLIEKFLDPSINLSPNPVLNADGSQKYPALDNHAMGTIFEELVRRFNEENNEEAGEHWTPRDAVKLMAKLIFLPIADQIESGTYLLYDGACGTGGMLTVGEETLQQLAAEHGKEVATHLYGQDINAETYAICKADLLLKGEGEAADNIVGGPEHSTLSNDAFPSREFDFMLSNPPYGKSWKSDLERIGGKDGIKDARFVIDHAGDPEYSLITRSSDGQMLFLANMLSKMKHGTPLGSRIAEVHNGSSLFTGDAGQGESNIRRWIIEKDWLEAIVALPLNMFYNTGIATYIWVISNRKAEHRKGKVQLIDATQWFKPLRKNLGKKNCELSEEDIQRICDTFLAFKETEQSKIFPNAAFGYWKVTVERPLRLKVDLGDERRRAFRLACAEADEDPIANVVDRIAETLGSGPHTDFNAFYAAVERDADKHNVKLTAKRKKLLQAVLAERDEGAKETIAKVHKRGSVEADPLHGLYLFPSPSGRGKGEGTIVAYEPDPELRDTEQIPLLEEGGIDAFIRREVLPYAPDAWIDESKTQIGYEVSFTRHFTNPSRSARWKRYVLISSRLKGKRRGCSRKLLGEQLHERNSRRFQERPRLAERGKVRH
jgi:type I restriction enzyme M protein